MPEGKASAFSAGEPPIYPFAMISSQKTLHIGQQQLQVELQLDGLFRHYLHTGQEVRGKLILSNSGEGDIAIENARIWLEERFTSNKKVAHQPGGDSLELRGVKLAPGEKHTVKIEDLGEFNQHTFTYKHLSYKNTLEVEGFCYASTWAKGRKSHKRKPEGQEFRTSFAISTRRRPSFKYVPAKYYSTEQYSALTLFYVLCFIGGWIYTTLKFEFNLQRSIHLLLLLLVLLYTGYRFWNITVFRNAILEVVPNPGGPLTLRMLDLGSAFQRSLRVGYQIFEQDEVQDGDKKSIRRVLLKSQVVRVAEHGRKVGAFVELKLPWPQEDFPLPGSEVKTARNLYWRMVVWYSSLWGGVAEVAWPLEVKKERLPAVAKVPEFLELADLEEQKKLLLLKAVT
jgi:hypothetical protein